jgi:hypothetical protein
MTLTIIPVNLDPPVVWLTYYDGPNNRDKHFREVEGKEALEWMEKARQATPC